MAIHDRIHSLETEYAIAFYAEGDNTPGAGSIVDALMEAAAESHGVYNSVYLVNGSKLAHDVGHAEWSLPECRSARELAAYDKAADYLFIDSLVPRAEKIFFREGYVGRLAVVKNNADAFGHTYGCHENYQMLRDADLLMEGDFLRYITQCMVPFLVSRQILVGSGRLIAERRFGSAGGVHYELSQRSGFIETVVSGDTTRARPIFNLGREGESFSAGNFRRVHLVLGDANVSGWATWIKMGSTGLILRMIEDLFVGDVPVLLDPVAAVRAINQDLAGQQTVPLQTGGNITALDVQWHYYDLADQYLTLFGASDEDEDLMEVWGKALEDFEQDPMLLRDRADWAIKKQLIDTYLKGLGYTLENLPADKKLSTDLQAFDLQYHELSSQGLYTRMYRPDTLVTAEEIAQAQENPPPHTRARLRGEAIRLGRECGLEVRADRWTEITIEADRIRIDDPLEFDDARVARWDQPAARLEEAVQKHPGHAALHYKLGCCWQSIGHHAKALDSLRKAVELEPGDAAYMHGLARTLLLAGQYAEAVRWFDTYNRRLDGGEETREFVLDYAGMGDAYRLQGDYSKALQLYQKSLNDNTRASEMAHRNSGMVHLKLGQVENARTAFQRSLEQSVERLVSLVGLGAIALSRGDRDGAVKYFEQAVSLASVRAGLGLTPGALAYFQAVAAVGLEHDDGLDRLKAALNNQTPEAADGLFLLEPLVNLLAQADPPLRDMAAVQALVAEMRPQPETADLPPAGDLVRDRIVRWLGSALQASSVEVRRAAVTYLGWREPDSPVLKRLLPLLVEKAHTDADPAVRRAAVQVLGQPGLPVPGLMEELIRCLRDPSPAVRWAAQTSLDRLSHPEMIPAGVTELAVQVAPRRAPDRDDLDPLEWLESLAERQNRENT